MDKQSWSKPVKFEPGTARFRTIMNTKKRRIFCQIIGRPTAAKYI